MYAALGNRKLAIVREITKIHEEVINTTLKEANALYGNGSLKGEMVLIIEGKKEEACEITLEDAVLQAKKLVEKGLSMNMAAKEIASKTPFKKGDIYKALL